MKIAKRIGCGALGVVLLAVVIFTAVFFVVPAVKIHSMEQLSMEDAPTAAYADYMADTETIFGWCADLAAMGARRPGTDAGKQAQTYMKEKFEELGLADVSIIESETDLWVCDDWALTVNGEEISSYYISYSCYDGNYGSFSTPEGGVEAELVYVGSDTDLSSLDVEGKIVVADVNFATIPIIGAKLLSYLYYDPDNTLSLFSSKTNPYNSSNFPDNYYSAMECGAVGFIGVLADYIDSNEYNNEDYSYIGGCMALPGVWVTKSVGEELAEQINDGSVTANIKMSGSNELVEAGAVVGYLYGNSEETIMVQSHYDSVTTGAVEDASGSAVLLAMADYCAQIPAEERERTLLFISMDSHFSDYDTHDAVIAELFGEDCSIIANLCVEHIANEMVENDDGSVELSGEPEVRVVFFDGSDDLKAIVSEEIVRHSYGRTVVLPATTFGDEVPTDADMYYQEGLPIVNLISGPIYLYDNMDTIDKVAKDELQPTAMLLSDILWRMMELDADAF